MDFCLITGRTSKQGESREIGKATEKYRDNTAIVRLNEDDMEGLGLEEGSSVQVSTEAGSVTVKARKDNGLGRGVVFMPIGPWASKVVGGDTCGTGCSHAKGLSASLSNTDDNVKSLKEILAG